ncbi:ribosome biogenesis protein bop1-A [Brevipalpus obovatus]|uniref:ribosome biogenesis protein bop1-A n=1 Tax=Brevipalpus obovatus TaxID=246614 RepID=UPI003D9EAF07
MLSSSRGKRSKGLAMEKTVADSDSDWESMSSDEEDDDAAIESLDDESLGSLNEEHLPDSDDDGVSDAFDVGRVKNSIKSRKASGKVVKADEYQYDSSDEEDIRNTIGNIPIERYKEYEHLGYDWDGNKIMKPKDGDEVDNFLSKMDDPYYWRTVRDRKTGKKIILTDKDVQVIEKIRTGNYPDPNFNPYPEFLDLYSHEKMTHPIIDFNLRKRDFHAAENSEKHLIKKYMKGYEKAKKLGLKPPEKPQRFSFNYDLWEKEGDKEHRRYRRNIPPPKIPLPGHEESYNPPPEYLFDDEESKKWLDTERDERIIKFMPQKYERLLHVPCYKKLIKERYERCLDLYLCPRKRKERLNIDPNDLIPQLPKPKDLYPFPCIQSLVYTGHEDIVRCIDIEPSGQFLASVSDDHTFRVWEVLTGRCMREMKFAKPATYVKWCPDRTKCICLVVVDREIIIINPDVGEKAISHDTDKYFIEKAEQDQDQPQKSDNTSSIIKWKRVTRENDEVNWSRGIRMIIQHSFEVTQAVWHHKGDYFASVMPQGAHKSVLIHQMSKEKSQSPFTKPKGIVQCVSFHPSKPLFFVVTHRYVRIYDLLKQQLTKKLMANSKHVSSIAIHPRGENLIIGCFDLRLSWFDLELSDKPYKTMRYHQKGIRSVAFHNKYPLFASASDDASVIISHGMVYDDWNQNALIVPVKVLRGHKIERDLGTMNCCFHPDQPWVFSCGADSTIRLFTH